MWNAGARQCRAERGFSVAREKSIHRVQQKAGRGEACSRGSSTGSSAVHRGQRALLSPHRGLLPGSADPMHTSCIATCKKNNVPKPKEEAQVWGFKSAATKAKLKGIRHAENIFQ